MLHIQHSPRCLFQFVLRDTGPQAPVPFDTSKRPKQIGRGFPGKAKSTVFIRAHRFAHDQRQRGDVHPLRHQLDHVVIVIFIEHVLGVPRTVGIHANRCQHRLCINGISGNANDFSSKERSDLTHEFRLGQSKPLAKPCGVNAPDYARIEALSVRPASATDRSEVAEP